MGLAEAEQWWERWQLRVLVLGSLSLQSFLLVAAALRRYRTPPLLRLLTWAAYLGSDALAIYALATLFTRHKKQQPAAGGASPSTHGRAELEALWPPVLLLHLGGQDGITAYSIQDNELWQRHLFTVASQVAIAVYVFRKSWPQGGDGHVLAAAILLFVPAILKCLQKPWALRMFFEEWALRMSSRISTATTALGVAKIPKQQGTSTTNMSIEQFLNKASQAYASSNDKPEVGEDDDDQARLKAIHQHHPHQLFFDLPCPYSDRVVLLKHMLHKGKQGAHLFVRTGLSRTFDRLYTAGYGVYLGALVRAVLVLLLAPSMAMVIVATTSSRRGPYDAAAADLKVTYILLCCTACFEVVSAITMACFQMMAVPPWPDEVAQCNLIGYLVHNEAHRWVRRLASLLGCQAYLDWLWCTAPSRTARSRPSSSSSSAGITDPSPSSSNGSTDLSSSSSDGITDLIYTHIADQWKKPPELDTATYRLSDNEGCGGHLASSSLERPFDECVMVWHLATDMCFFHSVGDEKTEGQKRQCRAISNYMAYLLLVNPEMLMPGARRRIFTVAYYQVREVIVDGESPEDEDDELWEKKVPLPPGGNQDMARKLIQILRRAVKTTKDGGMGPPPNQSLVRDAWALAQELMEKEEKTWRMIQGVWVEMLCFSASRCRGYLHAKSLGTRGEYLSYVWLLRAYMGMETLAHRMQATEEGDLGIAQPPTVVTGGDHV